MSTTAASPRTLADLAPASWVRDVVLVVAGTAFISVAAQISLPLPFTPVPLTLQTFAVLATSAALGRWRGLGSTALYLLAALGGLPVVAPNEDGSHAVGAALIAKPSFGYLLGFMLASVVVGRLAENGYSRTITKTAVTMVAGNLAVYAIGAPFLKIALQASWADAIAWGVTPFLIGDIVKVALAAGLFPALWAAASRFRSTK